jgi:hypothetical protein
MAECFDEGRALGPAPLLRHYERAEDAAEVNG